MSINQRLLLFLNFLLSVIFLSRAEVNVAWWSSVAQLSTSNILANNTSPFCRNLRGLSLGQMHLCELFGDHMPAVGNGARNAIEECEYQFRNQRWNCSTPAGAEGVMGPIHKLGTREAAFTYAIMSAGVTHEIGRRCRLGQLQSCGCFDNSKTKSPIPHDVEASEKDKQWTWGGCGDNVDYGIRFSRNFIDVREDEETSKRSESHARKSMNKWNNKSGRKILKQNMKSKCKCHGVSGSCNMKTCWMQLPTVREVGSMLEGMYQNARQIKINARGNLQFEGPPVKKPSSRKKRDIELVFLDDSPDYCRQDIQSGTIGTKDRVCTRSPRAANSCDLLCCGRGYNSYIKEEVYKCNCKFQWCCEVVCQECRNKTEVFVCK